MTVLQIGAEPLTPDAVVAAARNGSPVELCTPARDRIAANRAAADAIAASRPVYGRTTGVGANRHVAVQDGGEGHALRLLGSHAGGLGAPLPTEVVRATILIRLNQIAAAGGGHRPEIADALVALLRDGPLPELHDLGGIGTGDLTVLAELARQTPFAFGDGDALPFISSNAATLAVAALAWADLEELLYAGLGVAAASFRALEGNGEAYAEPVHALRPLPGAVAVAARMRALTEGAGPAARLQDPFGLRCVPQVAGALHGALAALHGLIVIELNAATENPLVTGEDVLHHGGFHAASLALALDTARLGLVPFAALSVARLSHLMEPELTGLDPFLASGAPGSSGLMIAEYLATDALGRLRADAAPAVLGAAVVSRGLEEHASFAWQGALQARRAAEQLRTVLALEWVAAERAAAMKAGPLARSLADEPLAAEFASASGRLSALAATSR